MSWWVPDPELEDDESVLWRTAANRAQDKRQVGGTLLLTERRLLFSPGRFDRMLDGRSWEVHRAAITAVKQVPRTAGLHFGSAAGLRRRMRVSSVHGADQIFTVNHLSRKITELGALLVLPT